MNPSPDSLVMRFDTLSQQLSSFSIEGKWTLALVGLVSIFTYGCGSSPTPAKAPKENSELCSKFDRDANRFWGVTQRNQTVDAIGTIAPEAANDLGKRLISRLDKTRDEWLAIREELCTERERADESKRPALIAQERCLSQIAEYYRALVTKIASGEPAGIYDGLRLAILKQHQQEDCEEQAVIDTFYDALIKDDEYLIAELAEVQLLTAAPFLGDASAKSAHALELAEKSHSSWQLQRALVLHGRANLIAPHLEQAKRIEIAKQMSVRADKIARSRPPDAASLEVLELQRDIAKAENAKSTYLQLCQKSVELARSLFGEKSPKYGEALVELGDALTQEKRFKEAEMRSLAAQNIFEQYDEIEAVEALRSRRSLVELYRLSGDHATSVEYLIQLREATRRIYGSYHPSMVRLGEELARIQLKQGDANKAKQVLLDSHHIAETIYPEESRIPAEQEELLAQASYETQEFTAAFDWLSAAARRWLKAEPQEPRFAGAVMYRKGQWLTEQHRFDDALRVFEEARHFMVHPSAQGLAIATELCAASSILYGVNKQWGPALESLECSEAFFSQMGRETPPAALGAAKARWQSICSQEGRPRECDQHH